MSFNGRNKTTLYGLNTFGGYNLRNESSRLLEPLTLINEPLTSSLYPSSEGCG